MDFRRAALGAKVLKRQLVQLPGRSSRQRFSASQPAECHNSCADTRSKTPGNLRLVFLRLGSPHKLPVVGKSQGCLRFRLLLAGRSRALQVLGQALMCSHCEYHSSTAMISCCSAPTPVEHRCSTATKAHRNTRLQGRGLLQYTCPAVPRRLRSLRDARLLHAEGVTHAGMCTTICVLVSSHAHMDLRDLTYLVTPTWQPGEVEVLSPREELRTDCAPSKGGAPECM